MKRAYTHWICRNKSVPLGEKTLVIGILNTTPDSFSDGGKHHSYSAACVQANALIQQGANIIDIGGESTRPGAKPVSAQTEIERTKPVIDYIRKTYPNQLISIDTTKAIVAEAALNAGADIINDISALQHDPDMAPLAAQTKAGVILMHKQGTPQNMQKNPTYQNVVEEVRQNLSERLQAATQLGIENQACIIDPGIGFGKTLEHNLDLLRNLAIFTKIAPVLVGLSRKQFIGTLTQKENPTDRLTGSLAAAAYALSQGIHILRVHDVIETCELTQIFDRLLKYE